MKYKYLVKLTLLGDAGSGKTCLMNKLAGRECNSDYKHTVSATFVKPEFKIQGETVLAFIWDTAGLAREGGPITITDRLPYNTQLLKGTHVFFICIDPLTKLSKASITKWLDKIAESGCKMGDVPVCLVLTKIDALEDTNRLHIAENLKDELGLSAVCVASTEVDNDNLVDVVKALIETSLKSQIEGMGLLIENEDENIPLMPSPSVENLHLPTISAGKQKREENQIQRIWNNPKFTNDEEKILAILNQVYTKSNNRFFRVIKGCWARHHVKQVEQLIKQASGKSAGTLVEEIREIANARKFNPKGTLATIIKVINNNRLLVLNAKNNLVR